MTAPPAVPHWFAGLLGPGLATDGAAVAAAAAIALVLLAVLGGIASYVDSYYTESVGQWVANDLRMRLFNHAERLSFNYFDTHQTGLLLSTITDDVATVQDFVSSSTLSILVDLLTIVGMLGLMFWLNWDFTLIVVAVTPVLLLFVARFRRAVKRAAHEVRRRESDIVDVLQTGLESVRTVQAFPQAWVIRHHEELGCGVEHARRIKQGSDHERSRRVSETDLVLHDPRDERLPQVRRQRRRGSPRPEDLLSLARAATFLG